MRFLVDECTGPATACWLSQQQYEVFSVYEEARGMDDEEIIHKAFIEDRILITNDKDFGEKIYREKKPHKGVILLRLEDERAANKIAVLQRFLEQYFDQLTARPFIVLTETKVRFAR
jgi:predicted nuclease of predicted toxin-antitoxin system